MSSLSLSGRYMVWSGINWIRPIDSMNFDKNLSGLHQQLKCLWKQMSFIKILYVKHLTSFLSSSQLLHGAI
jgi:hypothetical protein